MRVFLAYPVVLQWRWENERSIRQDTLGDVGRCLHATTVNTKASYIWQHTPVCVTVNIPPECLCVEHEVLGTGTGRRAIRNPTRSS